MLASIDFTTSTFSMGRRRISTAGRKAHSDTACSSCIAESRSVSTIPIGFCHESAAHTAKVIASGSTAVCIIFLILSISSVPVTAATVIAHEDTGDPLSPKSSPDMITPAVTSGSTPPLLARAMKMTPTVPATPKHVPSA